MRASRLPDSHYFIPAITKDGRKIMREVGPKEMEEWFHTPVEENGKTHS